MAYSGRGKRSSRPSFSMFEAPRPLSSAGSPMRTSVPRQLFFARASRAAAPTSEVMWTSCPQACITGTSTPASSFATTRLAYGSPVFSSTGSASMSARISTVGPLPFFITATTPKPPTLSVTS